MKRVLMVVLVLAATPFLAGVAQNPAATKASTAGQCATADAHRSPTSWQNSGQPDKNGRVGCSPVAPTPPPPPPAPAPTCSSTPAATGTTTITGTVLNSATWTGLANWCVTLSGTVSGEVLTDASGNYTFSGLPDGGNYTVCEVAQTGWQETFPDGSWGAPCASGFGWSLPGASGFNAFVNFMNGATP